MVCHDDSLAVRHNHFFFYAGIICSSTSNAGGMPLSLATAGFTATFTIQARDSWNNIRTLGVDSFLVRLTGPGTENHKVTPRYIGAAPATNLGRWSVGLRTTQSGNFSMSVQTVSASGLVGTYFRDANLSTVGTSVVDPTVNFVWGAGSPSPDVGLVNAFSVQWTGFTAPQFSEQYTFWTKVAEPDERVKLWVDTEWIVDQWSSLSSTQPTGTTWLVGNVLYDVKVQYKEMLGNAQISLLWESTSRTLEVIPSYRLFSSSNHVAGSPFQTTVFPALTSGAVSIATGQGLSLATAGIPAGFTIQAKVM
jgi:hypothetical protein